MAEETKRIYVKGSSTDRKVALWERNDAHPNGEVFVTNNGRTYEVGETPTVKRLMGEGVLVEGKQSDFEAQRVNWNSRTGATVDAPAPGRRRGRQPHTEVPELREATTQEENAAGLRTETERETARVSKRD